jgi:glycosyltransferase involved in cell wall biosynthesis
MKRLISRVLRRTGLEIRRTESASTLKVFSFKPRGSPRGNVCISNTLGPFKGAPNEPISNKHTCDWEAFQILNTFLELGYAVDAVHLSNQFFEPQKEYSVFVGVLASFGRIAPQLNSDCIKILHIVYGHWLFHNFAQLQRLRQLQARRGISLMPYRLQEPHLGIEYADVATTLGNDFTISTYEYAGKPIFRIPISTTKTFDWPEKKDFDKCRKTFLWFGSSGFVHKGLDLVLEAFAAMPDYQLIVCGPIQRETKFAAAFRKELFETPNISMRGWIAVESPEFLQIVESCIAVISPSCCESGGGATILCMHAGLIPIASREASVDIEDEYGILLEDSSIDRIKSAVRRVSEAPTDRLAAMSRKAWEHVRAEHTREKFSLVYRSVISNILETRGLKVS